MQVAPLLCAGLIGFRALRLCGEARRLGLYGFGAAAHVLAQVATLAGPRGLRVHPARATRRRSASRSELGADWAAFSGHPPPAPLDAAIIFAPDGALVPLALRARRSRRDASSAAGST